MRKKIVNVLFMLALIIGLTSASFAQTQTGRLEGTILDDNNQPLPGVLVTIKSLSLLGTQDFLTTDKGSFRFPALPPGEYTITCELSGFTKVNRIGITVKVGDLTTIEVTLKQSTISEEMTITAPSPVVDIKSSKSSVTYTAEMLQNLPMNRSLMAFVQSAPGMTSSAIGQTSAGYGGIMSAYGGSATNNTYMVDGLDFNNPQQGQSEITINIDVIDEMQIETGGHPAEVGRTPGAFINVVTRSGGNTVHGQLNSYWYNKSIVDTNITEEETKAFGIGKPGAPTAYIDTNLSVGGPVIKDKVWFFLQGAYTYSAQTIQDFPEEAKNRSFFGVGKLTFQLKKNIKLISQYSYRGRKIPNADASRWRTVNATRRLDAPTQFANAQLNWILSPDVFLDFRGMWLKVDQYWRKRTDVTLADYQTQDWATGMISGYPGYGYEEEYLRQRRLFSGAITAFKDNFLGGAHEFKAGAEYEQTYTHADAWAKTGIISFTWYGSPYIYGGNLGYFNAMAYGPNEGDGMWKWEVNTMSAFLQDTWTYKRLALNLGVRFERQSACLPAQSGEEVPALLWLDPVFYGKFDYPRYDNILVFNDFSPRLGLIFDIFGNGKTVAKAYYGRYYERMLHSAFTAMNVNAFSGRAYYWGDLNMDGNINPGDYVYLLYSQGRYLDPPSTYVDPNIKNGYWDEYNIGFEHELLNDFKVGVRYIYRKQPRIVEDIEYNMWDNVVPREVTEPGFDGIFGTADDSKLAFYERTKPFTYLYQTNPKDGYRKYEGLEAVFQKKMSKNWQFSGSIVYSKATGTIGGAYLESLGAQAPFNSPNWLVNRDGRQDSDRPLIIKLNGTYLLPYGINFSAFFIHASGGAYARLLEVWSPGDLAYVAVNAEPSGTRRYPSSNNLDLRIEKEFRIGNIGRLGVYLDVYNAFNTFRPDISSIYQGRIEADGSFTKAYNWLRITGVSAPRMLKLGARFTF